MTPKEKAQDLISKMNNVDKISNTYGGDIALFESIEHALVAVDEIIQTLNYDIRDLDVRGSVLIDLIVYWREVKQEIEREKQEGYGE